MTSLIKQSNHNTSSLNPTSMPMPNLSPLLTLIGWKDNSSQISQLNEEQRLLVETFNTDYQNYLASNNSLTRTNLKTSLDALSLQLTKEKAILEQRVQQVSQPKPTGYFQKITETIKTTLGIDEASESTTYVQQIQKYQHQLNELENLQQNINQNKQAPHRRLLNLPNTQVINFVQSCYPLAGACSLAQLANGQTGFGIEGEKSGDYSGYSISSAGDFNGDGIEDLLIGAYGALKIGKAYLIYGNNDTSIWQDGHLNLATLANGITGFAVLGEATNDAFGWSVTAGDYNGDGYSDLAIGSPGAQNSSGKTYIIRGTNNTNSWNYGLVNISSLMDGQHGYVLKGQPANDFSGYSITTVHNFTGNGISALVVGAPAIAGVHNGECYVVFGDNNTTWVNATMDLNSLMDGQRGVKFVGKLAQDLMALVVNSAGDLNGDGFEDLFISLRGKDQSSVVFGNNNRTLWGNGTVSLDTLMDGNNGVTFQGNSAELSGSTVGTAGDINGDGIDDAYIGASGANTNTGKVTLVFGDRNRTKWGNGLVNLTSLVDGQKGFEIAGTATNDRTGGLVNRGKDFNNDGLNDLIISAPGDSVNTGKTHIVYGSADPNHWNPGSFYVNYFDDGQKGFAIEGEAQNDFSSYQVDVADINADKIPDLLISAKGRKVNTGKTYVVFGKEANSAYFSNNYMSIGTGETIPLTSQHIAVESTRTDLNMSSLIINANNVVNGFFAFKSAPATSISHFTMQNILDGEIQFKHIGGPFPPSYSLDFNLGINRVSSVATIEFAGFRPILVNNQQQLKQGKPSLVGPNQLSASDQDNQPRDLNFILTDVHYGEFRLFNPFTNSSAPVTEFNYQDVINGYVTFIPDGSRNVPNYKVSVTDGISTSTNQTATISFNFAPELRMQTHPLILDEGQGTLIGANAVNVSDVETFEGALIISAVNISGGHFAYINNPNNSITKFSQSSVTAGLIEFVQQGETAPEFTLSASDGELQSPEQTAIIQFNHKPKREKTMRDQEVTQNSEFNFAISENLFSDADNDTLTYTAQQQGGAPLPDGVSFSASGQFSGKLSVIGNFPIEIIATDSRGLKSSALFVLRSQEATGLKPEQALSIGSGIGSSLFSVLLYLWIRRKITKHRHDFPFTNYLRTTLNLEYYDFSRFDGDTFKTKIENFLNAINAKYSNFYSQLTEEEQKSFSVCVAEILIQTDLISPSNIGSKAFNFLCCLNVGSPSQLDLQEFDKLGSQIAERAIANWTNETKPLKKWPYLAENKKERCAVFFCNRKPYSQDRFIGSGRIELGKSSKLGLFANPAEALSQRERAATVEENKLEVIEMVETEQAVL